MFDINVDLMDRSEIVREFTEEEISANPNAGILEIWALEAANPGQDYIWCPADTAGAWYIAQWEAKKAAQGIISMVNHPNRNKKAAERRLEAALDPEKRQLADKLEVLLAAAINQDKRISKWEMEFLSGTLQRFERYGEQIRLTAKQIEIVEKIHEKVKDMFAI